MKEITLVVIIGLALELLAGTYFSLIRLEVFKYDRTIGDIMSFMYILGNISLFIFFIRLYQKQSN